jgi:hypothetical protein
MVNATVGGTPSETLSVKSNRCRVIRLWCEVLLFLMAFRQISGTSIAHRFRNKPRQLRGWRSRSQRLVVIRIAEFFVFCGSHSLSLLGTWGRRTIIVGSFVLATPQFLVSQALSQDRQATLTRDYREGEAIAYRMKAVNEGHLRTIRYEAQAKARVKRDSSGLLVEDFAWTGLVVNEQPIPLTPASQQFREDLSLSPEYTLSVPDLSKVQPILIGPITDLLTFYADVQLAMRQKNLVRAGDHVYVKHGTPNSWADGTYTVFGQDSIDFDITLTAIDEVAHEATLVIRHVPPAQAQIQFPATWMVAPVGNLPNNWVEVEKGGQGKYSAEVGKETFEVVIKLSLPSGRIVSAEMDNPVDVLGRDCDDAALSKCGAPNRYGIRRRVYLSAEKPE